MIKLILHIICLIILLHPHTALCLDIPDPDLADLLDQHQPASVKRVNILLQQIRDNQIKSGNARQQLTKLLSEIRTAYYQHGGIDTPTSAWHFPVAGCTTKAITGGRKHGYLPRGYNFYTGNRHGGHPSLDIFIHDKNQDGCDDRSGKPVPVFSITSGIVIAAENDWKTGSRLRGGKYLWIYDPGNDLLLYYAHNDTLQVGIGDTVHPGDAIATVGRTGYNAVKKRSPTHLHLTALKISGGGMKPVDIYQNLKSSTYRKAD